MKRIVAVFLAVLAAVAAMAFVVSGAGETFSVTVSGDVGVPVGEEVAYKIVIGDVAEGTKLRIIQARVVFDTNMFEYVSCELDASATTVSQWDFAATGYENGVLDINIFDNGIFEDDKGDNSLIKGKSIVYVLTLKVKENASETGYVRSTVAKGGETGNTDVGALHSLDISLKAKLSLPTNLTWEGSVAKWDAVDGADSYVVQAYKGGATVGDPVTVTETSLDFRALLLDGGQYTFTVIAVTNDPTYFDSDESMQSETEYTVVGRLAAPKIKLTQNLANGGFDFVITDTNASGTVSGYRIDVYEKNGDTAVTSVNVSKKSGSLACDGTKIVAGKDYVATVTAITADAAENRDSDPSSRTTAVTAVAKVKKITFKTEPKLAYTEGDKLDLSAMVVTLTYENGETVNVVFSDFALYHLTTDPENALTLQMKHNGDSITVSYAGAVDSKALTLQVKSAECPHANKEEEHKEASCGEAGYDREICADCGVTVTETTHPATGLHSYGNWIVEIEPTQSMKGVKKRICAICNLIEYGEVDFVVTTTPSETNAPVTAAPESDEQVTTSPEETDPVTEEEEEEVENSMDDLSLIFLIVVIVIFALILIFMVGGVFMEGRRKKARSANRKRQPPQRG